MSQNASALFLGAMGFTSVAALTLFFSSRRKLFIRTFVPADELRDAVRGLRAPSFRSGMRLMAAIQFAVSACIWIAFVIVWLL